MKKIRYHNVDGSLISTPILIKDAIFQGTITPGFNITIINNKSEMVFYTTGKDLTNCKALVRKEMKRLGANFLDIVKTKGAK